VTSDFDAAASLLRPRAVDLADAWHTIVTAEREQVEALPNRPRPEDFYGPVANVFRADPRRTDEPLLDAILELTKPDETWIDLGAGGGRYALPIALHTKAVYAVEPSQGMREVLADSAAENGIHNIETFAERWPCESKTPVADVCFICQVGYDIADIGPFVDEMEAHARRLCVAVMFDRAPISEWAVLWAAVHGEERVLLPAMGEFVSLLYARGRVPGVRLLSRPPRTYESLEKLHAAARRAAWVIEGSPEDEKLGQAVATLSTATPEGFVLQTRPTRIGIITWEPR
jgi:SAM-dependent methyltransferase